jgi:hypothetical protein
MNFLASLLEETIQTIKAGKLVSIPRLTVLANTSHTRAHYETRFL